MAMAFVCRALAAVTTAGWAPGVTRGRVTLAATSTAPARTASVNAVRAGTESTAPLVGWEEVLDRTGRGALCVRLSERGLRVNKSVGCLSACVCVKRRV